MDPTQALDDARRALERYATADSPEAALTAANALGSAFGALDGWLSRGGFLPQPWSDARRETVTRLEW